MCGKVCAESNFGRGLHISDRTTVVGIETVIVVILQTKPQKGREHRVRGIAPSLKRVVNVAHQTSKGPWVKWK